MRKLILGHVLTLGERSRSLAEWPHGAILIDQHGKIVEVGDAAALKQQFPEALVTDYGKHLILPAFIDLHSHPPQLDIIGSFGDQLLQWLKNKTYPAELAFADQKIAFERTRSYIRAQLRSGATTGVYYGTTSEGGTAAMFEAAEQEGVRAVIGKVSMDQNGPKGLLQGFKEDREANLRLIKSWHGRDSRLFCALTPRFAPSCSRALLESLGELAASHPQVYIQTHLSENRDEVALAMTSHPGHKSYTAIYADHNLLGKKSILAHCIHLKEDEIALIDETQAVVAHCPTSNLFLGSGLCRITNFARRGLATDIGAGTTLCLWETARVAYGIAQLQGISLTPVDLLSLLTVESAQALSLTDLGRIAKAYDADFQVLDWESDELMSRRIDASNSAEERLLTLFGLASEERTAAVFCRGKEVYRR